MPRWVQTSIIMRRSTNSGATLDLVVERDIPKASEVRFENMARRQFFKGSPWHFCVAAGSSRFDDFDAAEVVAFIGGHVQRDVERGLVAIVIPVILDEHSVRVAIGRWRIA